MSLPFKQIHHSDVEEDKLSSFEINIQPEEKVLFHKISSDNKDHDILISIHQSPLSKNNTHNFQVLESHNKPQRKKESGKVIQKLLYHK